MGDTELKPSSKEHDNSRKDAPTGVVAVKDGDTIGNWVLKEKIESETGMNCIFVAEHKKDQRLGALKVEAKNEATPMLRVELFILNTMAKSKNAKHFCEVFDKGMEKDYNWICMTLIGRSLRGVRKESKNGRLSLACGLSVGMQCLKAVEELHKMGFIHRDLNPSNFGIGREETKEQRKVFLLDFGFAHQYKDAGGALKKPRPQPWTYRGHPRYAPRSAFAGKEFSRMEDLEMWFYMTVELCKGSLPWMTQRDPKNIYEYQKAVRNCDALGMRELLGGLPVEFVEIMKQIDKLTFYDEPNYNEIYGLIGNAIMNSGQSEFPYDWEKAAAAPAK